jgi:hypothetical protein
MLMTWVNLGGRGAASEVCEFELGALVHNLPSHLPTHAP